MGRFARENEFDPLVKNAVESVATMDGAWPIPKDRAFALVKGITAAESGFNPSALRGEPQIRDASIGLMQILYATAKGLGFPGPIGDRTKLTGLYAPATNLYYGARLLRKLLLQAGNEAGAMSAYNGGYRPDLGFGRPRTATTPRVCLQWKSTAPASGRTIDRDCEVLGSTTPGTYSNQRYVDKVKNYTDYFFRTPPVAGPGRPDVEVGSHQVSTPLVLSLLGLLGGLLVLRGKRGT